MGSKTKIEWAEATWNPITGCLRGCEYCYARKIAQRFGGVKIGDFNGQICELDEPYRKSGDGSINPYPYEFLPTLHRYLLNKPQEWKKPRNVFVGSMADMWGMWVPDNWKIEVIEACRKAPQHNYLFLTKDPIGYSIWPTKEHKGFDDIEARTDNMWLGVTYTGTERLDGHYQEWEKEERTGIWTNFWYLWRMCSNITPGRHHNFLSIEPLKCDICEVEDEREGGTLLWKFLNRHAFMADRPMFEWVIVGAETGNRNGKVKPKKEWVEKLAKLCEDNGIPLMMKESLLPIMGEAEMKREIPDGLRRD